jgi:hypothetical protein
VAVADFDYVTFAAMVAAIIGLGLLLFYFLKRIPSMMRSENPRKAQDRLKDDAFNALNSLSSLVRMARQQGKEVEDVTPMLREARSAYDSGDYEGARRTATMGKEVFRAKGLSLRKEIVKKEEKEEGEDDAEEAAAEPEPEPAPRTQAPAVSAAAPPPVMGPTIANGGEDETMDEGAEGGEKKDGEEEEFETPASVLRKQKPRNYMEAKFMILQVENFLTGEERAGRINKEARRDLEESKRHFKENDFDMSLALASRAKRATGKTEDFVKVSEKEEEPAPGAEPAGQPVPAPAAVPRASSAAARAAQAATARLCGNCGAPVAAKDKFCRECGATAARQCPKCSEALEAKDKFCGGCGARV